MARHTLHLTLDTPSLHIVLDARAQELWNKICFHEEAQQYREYDVAWDDLLTYLRSEIEEAFWDDFSVDRARVDVGG